MNLKHLNVILIILFVYCSSKNYLEELQSLKCLNQNIIENNELFIVTRSSYCTDCFQRILEELEMMKVEKATINIVVGNNYKEINNFADNFPDLIYFEEVDSNFELNINPVVFVKKNETLYKYVIYNPDQLKGIFRK